MVFGADYFRKFLFSGIAAVGLDVLADELLGVFRPRLGGTETRQSFFILQLLLGWMDAGANSFATDMRSGEHDCRSKQSAAGGPLKV